MSAGLSIAELAWHVTSAFDVPNIAAPPSFRRHSRDSVRPEGQRNGINGNKRMAE